MKVALPRRAPGPCAATTAVSPSSSPPSSASSRRTRSDCSRRPAPASSPRGAPSCSLTLSSRSSSWPPAGCWWCRPRRDRERLHRPAGLRQSLADVRTDARAALAHLPDARMHVSGCPRRCGAPAPCTSTPSHCRTAATSSTASPAPGSFRDPRLRPGQRRDLPQVVRHDPRRGRPVPADLAPVAVRMIHACGQVDLTADIACSPTWSPHLARPSGTAPRSSATPRWWPPASRGPACPPATTSSAPCAIPGSPVSPTASEPPARPRRSSSGGSGSPDP